MREKTFTTFQIADLCGVYPTTVINWIKKGQLKAFTTPGGHRRVMESELKAFLDKYQIPVNVREGSTPRVLIIEDDRSVGALLEKTVRKASSGIEVEWIQDGVEALVAIGARPPDLVILDIGLPTVDGGRVLASLRGDKESPASAAKVIVVTGKRLPPEKLRFIRKHSEAFFQKPFDVKELSAAVAELLKLPKPVPA